jgi:colanic acid/amylovoran biosynthesis glycosyltransferase
MKLCILSSNKFSYSETFIRNHVNNLVPDCYLNNGWYPITTKEGKSIFSGIASINIIRIGIKNIFPVWYKRLYNNALANYLKENNITTVLAEYGIIGYNIIEACKKANCIMVVHFHGFDAFEKNTLSIYREKYKELFVAAHKIVAVSIDMQKQLIKLGASKEKVAVISYGVDLKLFLRKNELPLNPIIVAVGRFTEKKSPQNTIQAFKKVLEKRKDAQLIMIGDGELFEQSKKLANDLNIVNSIDFKGVLPPNEIALELQKAKIFVQHSVVAPSGDSEGFPNSILEAAATGLPVVSTYHAGIPEIILSGKTGFLVKEHDIEGMANYILNLLDDDQLAITMGQAATKHIQENYSLEKQIASLHTVLKND